MKIIKFLLLILAIAGLAMSKENDYEYIDLDSYETDDHLKDLTLNNDIYEFTYGTGSNEVDESKDENNFDSLDGNKYNNGLYETTLQNENMIDEIDVYELEPEISDSNEGIQTKEMSASTQIYDIYYDETTIKNEENTDVQYDSYELESIDTNQSQELKSTVASVTEPNTSNSIIKQDEHTTESVMNTNYTSSLIEQHSTTSALKTDGARDSITSIQSTTVKTTVSLCSLSCSYGYNYDTYGRILCSCYNPCEVRRTLFFN
jgi:hypothetical protein